MRAMEDLRDVHRVVDRIANENNHADGLDRSKVPVHDTDHEAKKDEHDGEHAIFARTLLAMRTYEAERRERAGAAPG